MGTGLAEEAFGLLTNSQSLKLFVLGLGCTYSPCSFSSSNVYQVGFLCKLT